MSTKITPARGLRNPNMVVKRGVNEHGILPMACHFRRTKHSVVQGIEAHRDATKPSVLQCLCLFCEQRAVRRQREIEARDARQHRDQTFEDAAALDELE